ncbi:Dyp-type peroxidase [Chitinimonas arctica]|uniref:Dyp-type peroxidase n=1 Tax=Chitinimonas arctica TaxID=2594795 RepID=A0A516SGE6_9NEIS|nr:Dyp-type peroxidase [Chitinimonas arctica]QDQ27233.1 Dyp-type peroxidase [Chitinimonas arctica]
MSLASLAQTAICAVSHAHGLFLGFDLLDHAEAAAARCAIGELAARLDDWVLSVPAARNCWAIAVGSEAWLELVGTDAPRELQPFPHFEDARYPMPVTPHALFIHLRSERHDLCHQAGQLAQSILARQFVLADCTAGFRYLDSRDLTGFVDGTENPPPEERPEVALVDDDGAFNGGSYLHVQRYVHDLRNWERLPVAEQEGMVGRSKADDIEMDDAVKPAGAHIARVVIEEDGEELEIVRQSLPYGQPGAEQGLFFVSYCKTPRHFNLMLARMNARSEGEGDHLLRFSRAVSSAAYFAPPMALLRAWAG